MKTNLQTGAAALAEMGGRPAAPGLGGERLAMAGGTCYSKKNGESVEMPGKETLWPNCVPK